MQPVELSLHQKLMNINPFGSDTKLWFVSTFLGLALFTLVSGYYYVRQSYSIEILNIVLADVALLLIGLSFILSSLCYFWNFADKFIIYRKHLGLVGFLFGFTHVVMSMIIYPEYVNIAKLNIADDFLTQFIYGLLALTIYTMMVFISNRFAVHELGGTLWRRLLRVGYIGYICTLLHFAVSLYHVWLRWFELVFQSPRLPPFSMIGFIFGCVVIAMRLALWMHITLKKSTPTTVQSPTLPSSLFQPQQVIQHPTQPQTFVTTQQQYRSQA